VAQVVIKEVSDSNFRQSHVLQRALKTALASKTGVHPSDVAITYVGGAKLELVDGKTKLHPFADKQRVKLSHNNNNHDGDKEMIQEGATTSRADFEKNHVAQALHPESLVEFYINSDDSNAKETATVLKSVAGHANITGLDTEINEMTKGAGFSKVELFLVTDPKIEYVVNADLIKQYKNLPKSTAKPTSKPTAKATPKATIKVVPKATIKVVPKTREPTPAPTTNSTLVKKSHDDDGGWWWWLLLILLLLVLLYLFWLYYSQLLLEQKAAEDAANEASRQEMARRIVELRTVVMKNSEAFQLMQMTRVPQSRVQPLRAMMQQNIMDIQKLKEMVERMGMVGHAGDDPTGDLNYLQKEIQALLDLPDQGPGSEEQQEQELQQALETKNHRVLEQVVSQAEADVAAGMIMPPPSLANARKVLADMDRAAAHSYLGCKGTRSVEDFFRGRSPLDQDANYHRKNTMLQKPVKVTQARLV